MKHSYLTMRTLLLLLPRFTLRRLHFFFARGVQRGAIVPAALGLIVLLAGLATVANWLDWPNLGRWLGLHASLMIVFGIAAVFLGIAFTRAMRRVPRRRSAPGPPLSWWVVAAAAAVVTGVAWGTTTWLLHEADQAQDPAAARVEAIKTGLGIGAGTGGVFALLLAVRRQWRHEVSAAATEMDAAEKRVTELYTKAVDQLGSDKAPVRLAGLYALERVAQNNPEQRQTIVNVLCAYLRMPFQPPGDPVADDANEPLMAAHRERVQEREVRLTAQRLLTDHLWSFLSNREAGSYWRDINLDLTGAILIDFSLAGCTMHTAAFRSATFIGEAAFNSATFTGDADFRRTTFTGEAQFERATFASRANFGAATFASPANFGSATFGSPPFGSATSTNGADAAKDAASLEAILADHVVSMRALVSAGNAALFGSATFNADADFRKATFAGDTDFGSVTFACGVPAEVARLPLLAPKPRALKVLNGP